MDGQIIRQSSSYRQGLVLGLTMAEIMILLVFCLLIAMAAFLRVEHDRRELAEKELGEERAARSSERDLVSTVKQNLVLLDRLRDGVGAAAEAAHRAFVDAGRERRELRVELGVRSVCGGPAGPVGLRVVSCASARDLEQAAAESFNQHPDAGIITSFPGIGTLTGARVLAETGDDRSRFQDARGLKAYAGSAPITRASGKTRSVTHRKVKTNRLAAAGYTWAFAALTASPGARAHYDRRREAGDRHTAAQRNLFNRLLGCLHHCLATGQHYNETTAFPNQAARKTAA